MGIQIGNINLEFDRFLEVNSFIKNLVRLPLRSHLTQEAILRGYNVFCEISLSEEEIIKHCYEIGYDVGDGYGPGSGTGEGLGNGSGAGFHRHSFYAGRGGGWGGGSGLGEGNSFGSGNGKKGSKGLSSG